MHVCPIPHPWKETVLTILREGNPDNINWTIQAVDDWQRFGLEYQAYELLIQTLSDSEVIGQQVIGMRDRRDGSYTDCWAFLCDHPQEGPKPLYAKIGIHCSQIYINLFSLHIDDGSNKLLKAIAAYRKRNSK